MSEEKEKKVFKRGNKKNFERKKEGKLPPKMCMNDPLWYVLNPELLKDAASLPFSHFIGKGFPVYTNVATSADEACVFKLPYLYMFGVSAQAGDPVNLAIRNLYTYVRHQNSGHTNYESADLGLYLLAVSSVVATLAHLERCIGVAKCYQRRSAIMPKTVLDVLGVNYSSFISNLANYTTRLNVLWSRVSSLCIPKDFSFLKRWVWMNSQIFKDHESDKAALYVFKPVGVPKFNQFVLDAGSISQPNKESITPTINDWFNDAEDALDRILGDEDMNIMSGDILKAYGRENLMTFGMTPIDYVLEPVYVEEMLPQIQHAQTPYCATISGSLVPEEIATGITYDVAQAINDVTNSIYTAAGDDDYFTIYQYNGEIICQPAFRDASVSSIIIDTTTKAAFWKKGNLRCIVNDQDRLLNSFKEVVPPEDVMISTRLMYVEEYDTRIEQSGEYAAFVTSCGTELITGFNIYVKSKTNPITRGFASGFNTLVDTGSVGDYSAVLRDVLLKSQMDWAPITYVNTFTSGLTPAFHDNQYIAGDLDNFTAIAVNTLKGLHLTALLAEFSVTQYNLITNK